LPSRKLIVSHVRSYIVTPTVFNWLSDQLPDDDQEGNEFMSQAAERAAQAMGDCE